MISLTASKEHYIKTIYNLSPENKGVHITEIAEKLDITKASVCTAMKTLQKDGFIYRCKKRLVFLSEKGEELALYLSIKFKTIKSFLINVLQMDSASAAADACTMEHIISSDTLSAMASMIQNCK